MRIGSQIIDFNEEMALLETRRDAHGKQEPNGESQLSAV